MSVIADSTADAEAGERRRGGLVGLLIRMKGKPLGSIGAVLVLVLLFSGIFADLTWLGMPQIGLVPDHYNIPKLMERLQPPMTERADGTGRYWLGTDNLGRDLLSRVIYGARISMIVGLSATAISTVLSVVIGLISGFVGGKIDLITQRFIDAWICFPGLVIYLIVMSLLGPGMLQLVLVLGIGGGIGGARGTRALAFWIKESTYIGASQAIGCSTWRMMWRHLLPNVMPMIIVGFSMSVGGIILAEAGLSFLGFGIPPPFPSWGAMLTGSGRSYMFVAPWLALWPGVALTLAVFGVNVFGDAVRDLLDPRLRGGMGGLGGFEMEQARKALRKREAKAEKASR